MSSIYAITGTAAHTLLEECLKIIYEIGIDVRASDYIGHSITVPKDEPGEHKTLSPSGAKKWMTCSASPRMEKKYPEDLAPETVIEIDAEMAASVQVALDYVAERVAAIRAEYGPVVVRTERKVSLMAFVGTDDCDGTSDIAIIAQRYAEHIDYKHGKGVFVDEADPQNCLYMIGTCAEYLDAEGNIPFQQGRLTVVQPRYQDADPVRWVDIEDMQKWLMDWTLRVTAAVHNTHEHSDVFTPDDQGCRFCSAKADCTAHAQFELAKIGAVSPDAPMPDNVHDLSNAITDVAVQDPDTLSGAQITAILMSVETITGFLSAVKERATALVQEGKASPEVTTAFKLVMAMKNRAWAGTEDETKKGLARIKFEDPTTGKRRALGKKDLYKQVFLGPAPVEKILKAMGLTETQWKAFNRLVHRPEGGATLVPRTDRRAEIGSTRPSPEDAFADVDPTAPPDASLVDPD